MAKKQKVPDDSMPKCASCAFFLLDEPKDDCGYCHRYPPVFLADDGGSGWSHTVAYSTDWCGEFVRRVN